MKKILLIVNILHFPELSRSALDAINSALKVLMCSFSSMPGLIYTLPVGTAKMNGLSAFNYFLHYVIQYCVAAMALGFPLHI